MGVEWQVHGLGGPSTYSPKPPPDCHSECAGAGTSQCPGVCVSCSFFTNVWMAFEFTEPAGWVWWVRLGWYTVGRCEKKKRGGELLLGSGCWCAFGRHRLSVLLAGMSTVNGWFSMLLLGMVHFW